MVNKAAAGSHLREENYGHFPITESKKGSQRWSREVFKLGTRHFLAAMLQSLTQTTTTTNKQHTQNNNNTTTTATTTTTKRAEIAVSDIYVRDFFPLFFLSVLCPLTNVPHRENYAKNVP